MKHPTDEEIEKEAEWINILERNAFRTVAKWARDLQPKLKTLEWEEVSQSIWFSASTPFGAYNVFFAPEKDGLSNQWFWYWRWAADRESILCESKQTGMQLAQADYEKRVNELYV